MELKSAKMKCSGVERAESVESVSGRGRNRASKAVNGFSTKQCGGEKPLSAVRSEKTCQKTIRVRMFALYGSHDQRSDRVGATHRAREIRPGRRCPHEGDSLRHGGGGYIAEGVRRSRFPAIEFRDGQPGRVAYLVGSRWPVWMIVELVRELDGDLAEAVKLIRKPAALVRMALAYADAYPQEIEDSAALASRRDYAGMKQEIPELEQL